MIKTYYIFSYEIWHVGMPTIYSFDIMFFLDNITPSDKPKNVSLPAVVEQGGVKMGVGAP